MNEIILSSSPFSFRDAVFFTVGKSHGDHGGRPAEIALLDVGKFPVGEFGAEGLGNIETFLAEHGEIQSGLRADAGGKDAPGILEHFGSVEITALFHIADHLTLNIY